MKLTRSLRRVRPGAWVVGVLLLLILLAPSVSARHNLDDCSFSCPLSTTGKIGEHGVEAFRGSGTSLANLGEKLANVGKAAVGGAADTVSGGLEAGVGIAQDLTDATIREPIEAGKTAWQETRDQMLEKVGEKTGTIGDWTYGKFRQNIIKVLVQEIASGIVGGFKAGAAATLTAGQNLGAAIGAAGASVSGKVRGVVGAGFANVQAFNQGVDAWAIEHAPLVAPAVSFTVRAGEVGLAAGAVVQGLALAGRLLSNATFGVIPSE